MSDTTELVQSTIDKVLQRVDLLAAKLGIAAGEVWRFSVTAKAVEARAEIAKYAALFLLPVVLWGWSIHVLRTPVLHDYDTTLSYQTEHGNPLPCDQIGTVNGKQTVYGKQTVLHEQCWQSSQEEVPIKTDKGISVAGWILILSGVFTCVIGIGFAISAVEGVIDGYASTKTTEYDAYQDLIYDWKY